MIGWNGKRSVGKWRGALALAILVATAGGSRAWACDRLIGNLIAGAMRPAIASLGCGDLAKIGVRVADHALTNVCYTSDSETSEIDMSIKLHCSTKSSALIPSSVSETLTAHATVDGASCKVQDISIRAHGELGKVLLTALDAQGKARQALQKALDGVCAHP